MSDTLQALYDSTADLYARFGLDATTTPPHKRRPFFADEARELVEESALYEVDQANVHLGLDLSSGSEVAEEAADVLVTVIGLLQAHGISLAEFRKAIAHVTIRNDAKTAANGYAVIGGKIRKQSE